MPARGSISSERAAGELDSDAGAVDAVATEGDPAPHPVVSRRIDTTIGASEADPTRELWMPR
jgi:hypothetical protein